MNETTTIPSGLQHLPVADQINTIDFDADAFLIRAMTGSGKTMTVAPHEAMLEKAAGRKPCIVVRQPTKVTVQWTKSGIEHFWGELGLKVGICTRDEKDFEDADVIISSDGSLSAIRQKREVTHYYADEAHWLSVPAELECAVAKHDSIKLRLMSATIDPSNILRFLGEAPVYDLEGQCFPVTQHVIRGTDDVFDRDDHTELFTHLSEVLAETATAGESAIVFCPTRAMCESGAEHFAEDMPTTFVHGGVNPVDAEKWVNEHSGEPFAVFATTAAATGITLDLHRAILCDDIVKGRIVKGREITESGPLDSNSALQMMGRAGRLRAGDAYLIVADDARPRMEDGKWRKWTDKQRGEWSFVEPEPIKPPCENTTPYDVILTMGQMGIANVDDLSLISRLDDSEIESARRWLRYAGCIDDEGALTKMGRAVASFPMDARYAHAILTAPSVQSKLAILAAFTLGNQGTYGMVKVKPAKYNKFGQIDRIRQTNPDFTPWPRELLHQRSAPISLAKGLAGFARQPREARYGWAEANNFWAKPFYIAMKDFSEFALRFLPKGVSPTQALITLDLDGIAPEVHKHLADHQLFEDFELQKGMGQAGSMKVFYDSVFGDSFRLDQDGWWKDTYYGIPSMVQAKGFRFMSLGMGFKHE